MCALAVEEVCVGVMGIKGVMSMMSREIGAWRSIGLLVGRYALVMVWYGLWVREGEELFFSIFKYVWFRHTGCYTEPINAKSALWISVENRGARDW